MNKGFTPLENGHKKNSPVSLNGMNKPNKSFLPLEKATGIISGVDNFLTGFTPLHQKNSFLGWKIKNMLRRLPRRSGFIRDGLADVTGFTLVELMVVIVIIGIMAIIASPNMRSWYLNFETSSACDNITNTLITARMNAIKNGNNQVVFFYTADNCPTVVGTVPTNAGGTNCYFTINDPDNDIVSADSTNLQAGEFNGNVNTLISAIVFPTTLVPNSPAGFTVTTDYCIVTGLNSQPCAIPNSCTFCTGNVGAIAFQPNGSALFLGPGGAVGGNVSGGSVTIIPSSDVSSKYSGRECAVGVIGMTGAVKEFY